MLIMRAVTSKDKINVKYGAKIPNIVEALATISSTKPSGNSGILYIFLNKTAVYSLRRGQKTGGLPFRNNK